MPPDPLIRPSELKRLDGSEALGSTTVLDFWRWALGDLRMNNARGYLVEFLVAKAIGDVSPIRVEWGPYDVEGRDGTRVEVKATGRLQSWGDQAAFDAQLAVQERRDEQGVVGGSGRLRPGRTRIARSRVGVRAADSDRSGRA